MANCAIQPVSSVLDVTWVRKVRKHIMQTCPDAVISHGFNGHLLAHIGTMGMKNIVRLATYHGSYHAPNRPRQILEPVFNGFTHWYFRERTHALVSVSKFGADFLTEQGVDEEKITVVHNGIPDMIARTVDRQRLRAEWNIDKGEILIGVASRLEPVKGIKYLLNAVSKVVNHFSIKLVILGEGTVRQELQKNVLELGLDSRVTFLGMRSDVAACLSAFDIFALPSLHENHSIALLEAMRAGLAIVATDVGGNTESVRDGKEGLIVPPADAEALLNALEKLLSDAILRERYGAAARMRYEENFTEQAMVEATARWLSETLGA